MCLSTKENLHLSSTILDYLFHNSSLFSTVFTWLSSVNETTALTVTLCKHCRFVGDKLITLY